MFIDWLLLGKVVLRLGLAVAIGSIIGNERAKHGQAAGMRTHILVCVGAALTAMISVFLADEVGSTGDMTRISAQVISGIGFLGAGMIIVKNNNVISGLTTAAGVWTTSIIGIALGYGFYYGAIVAAVLFFAAVVIFAKIEERQRLIDVIYVEIDDMSKTNKVIAKIAKMLDTNFTHRIIPARSGNVEHLGISIGIDKNMEFDITRLCEIDHVVFVDED